MCKKNKLSSPKIPIKVLLVRHCLRLTGVIVLGVAKFNNKTDFRDDLIFCRYDRFFDFGYKNGDQNTVYFLNMSLQV